MATRPSLTDRPAEELSQILKNLSQFANPEAPLEIDPAVGKDALVSLIDNERSNLDNNVAPPAPEAPGFWGRLWGAEDKSQIERPRAGDLLKTTVAKALNPDVSINSIEEGRLESVLAAAGYTKTEIDGTLSTEEKTFLPELSAELNKPDSSISSMFTANAEKKYAADMDAEAKAAAEAAAKLEQTDIEAQVKGGLIVAGYLKPENADNPRAVQSAADFYLLNNTKDIGEARELSQKIFPNGETGDHTMTSEGVAILGGMMKKRPLMNLKEMLESGDQTTHVQGALRLLGHGDVQITGTIDDATKAAAATEIRKPIPTLDGMSKAQIYDTAVAGDLDFMKAYLRPEELTAMNALKPASERGAGEFTSQETYLAGIAIRDKERFANILEQENEKRAGATIELNGAPPKVAVNMGTPIREEAKTNALMVEGEESVRFGNKALEKADGVTNNRNLAVYPSLEAGLNVYTTSLMEATAPYANKATLLTAIDDAHYLSQSNKDFVESGAVGALQNAQAPTVDDAMMLSQQLSGKYQDPNYEFDLNNPDDKKALLTATVAYGRQNDPEVGRGLDAVANLQKNYPDIISAIDKVSGVTPAAQPAAPEQSTPQVSSYMNMFDRLARGEIEPVASEAEQRLQEVLDRRSGLASASPAPAVV